MTNSLCLGLSNGKIIIVNKSSDDESIIETCLNKSVDDLFNNIFTDDNIQNFECLLESYHLKVNLESLYLIRNKFKLETIRDCILVIRLNRLIDSTKDHNRKLDLSQIKLLLDAQNKSANGDKIVNSWSKGKEESILDQTKSKENRSNDLKWLRTAMDGFSPCASTCSLETMKCKLCYDKQHRKWERFVNKITTCSRSYIRNIKL